MQGLTSLNAMGHEAITPTPNFHGYKSHSYPKILLSSHGLDASSKKPSGTW